MKKSYFDMDFATKVIRIALVIIIAYVAAAVGYRFGRYYEAEEHAVENVPTIGVDSAGHLISSLHWTDESNTKFDLIELHQLEREWLAAVNIAVSEERCVEFKRLLVKYAPQLLSSTGHRSLACSGSPGVRNIQELDRETQPPQTRINNSVHCH
jgi:hypothetical protein